MGATGSIGTQALDILRKDRENFKLVAVSSHSSIDKLSDIVSEFNPSYVVVTEKNAYFKFREYCSSKNLNTIVLFGIEGLNVIASL